MTDGAWLSAFKYKALPMMLLNALDMKADEDSYTEEPVSDETRVPIPLAENTAHNTEGTQKIAIPHED